METKKSTIAVFTFAYQPFEGGAEIAAREVMAGIPEFNYIVFTERLNQSWPALETQGSVTVQRVGKGRKIAGDTTTQYYGRLFEKMSYVIRAWRAAEKRHREEPFRMIWAIMASYGGLAALLFKLRHPHIPFLLTLQEGDSETHLRQGLVGLLGKWLIRKADRIQAISHYLRAFALAQGARTDITVIPNGVDTELFQHADTPDKITALRNQFGVRGDDFVVITTSRLVKKNGIDLLLNALGQLRTHAPRIICLIIGDGPDKKMLQMQSLYHGVENQVRFIGQIPQAEIPLYFQIAHVFARASRSEGLGNSFLEAMGAGLPIIGTPVGGIVDFLHDGETGFLVPPEDARALAEKIAFVSTHPAEREKVARKGMALVLQHYTWEEVRNQFRNLFQSILSI